jgi:ribosome biogenesis GTPase
VRAGERVGTVIQSFGSGYDVQTDEGLVKSKLRGSFRLKGEKAKNPVVVGDRVTLREVEDGTGLITRIHERSNTLTRRAAGRRVGVLHHLVANIDMAWCVQSVRMPGLNPGFMDRFLVMTESQGLDAGFVFNKTDLVAGDAEAEEDVAFWASLYERLGYPVLRLSAEAGEGVDAFAEALAGRTSVVAGPSGVGKSTLLNAVEPGLGLRTGAVSASTRKGKHTTTNAALFPLTGGGFVADTPGIREYGIAGVDPADLDVRFVEFRPLIGDCRYYSCTHSHEPGCAVKEAAETGEISWERYLSYLNILESLGSDDRGR